MGHDLCITIMQLPEYRDCGVGSEGILCHYLLLILSNGEYSTEWLSELLPHIAHVSSISERLEQQQPLPSPAPKGKRTINGAVKQQSKGVFAAQGWSHKTELCPRLNKIVRKSQSTIKDIFLYGKVIYDLHLAFYEVLILLHNIHSFHALAGEMLRH